MKGELEIYVGERTQWQGCFDRLLKFGSEGVLKDEVLQAKKIFFAKLGSVHEMKEELFEATSQSFLEWYLFDYQTWLFSKSPAVVFGTLGLGSPEDQVWMDRALFEHWSLYEVLEIAPAHLKLKDLLFHQTRTILYDPQSPEARLWKIKVGQIIQARPFELSKAPYMILTHLWIHPDSEKELIFKICEKQAKRWSRHKTFLLEAFEAVVRSIGLQHQIQVSRSTNWLYRELAKKYA